MSQPPDLLEPGSVPGEATPPRHGFQGDALGTPERIIAGPKHFAGYGAALGGRDYDEVNLSDSELWNVYLPPFAAAVAAGAGNVMTAYMTLNGIPATGRTVEMTGTTLFRMADGRIAEEWTCANSLGLMRQLGMLPTAAAAPAWNW